MATTQSDPISERSAVEILLADADRALKSVDPAAVPVTPRTLRRVIMQDHELPGFGFQVPHRKSYLITQERLHWIVPRDELGLSASAVLPPNVILIAQPSEHRLATMQLSQLLAHYWRLLFHARVHRALDERLESGELTAAGIRQRIDRIGQSQFDEIHAVLRHEKFLLHPAEYEATYIEFAAVYLEFRHFSPGWLSTYFPSLEHWDEIDAILAEDVDGESLFENTRPPGAAPPQREVEAVPEDASTDWADQEAAAATTEPHEKTYRKYIARAEKASARGNAVKAAVLRMWAARYAPADEVAETSDGALAELDALVERLQAALEFDEAEARDWREALKGLLANSMRGFWSADRRLLYDLQKVCVDHEREISVVDLLRWMRSFGKSPLKRPLPNQREVLMAKHLRSAAGRLSTARLTGDQRERLSALLHAAARSAEHQLRLRLSPLIERALLEVGLEPSNVPERVAFGKLVEESLDCIVRRGYLTMGHLRDAISRNNLKLDNLSGFREFWQGDQLLRADRRLAQLLDGVYHRGEIYLRALQGLSSVSFGTKTGRFLTQYVALPFGGAYIILAALQHVLDLMFGHGDAPIMLTPYMLAGSGAFLLAMIHWEEFRQMVVNVFKAFYNVVHGFVIEIPNWIVNRTFIRNLLRSLPVVIFRRFALIPLVLTGMAALARSQLEYGRPPTPWDHVAVFAVLAVVLNSRIGRTIEAAVSEWVTQMWHRIRVRVFIALFELVMETFKRVLEWFERVLYAVDEWLRFKSGESKLTLGTKAVLGVVWAGVTFVISFCVTLLIEPQINPIKHFPVVTVSHKIILPSLPFLAKFLSGPLGPVWGNTVATVFVFVVPGVFGFLVWELKGNWQLYGANRPHRLKSVPIGDHGESMIRYLRPGFYSGTIPKLFGKLRRSVRHAHQSAKRLQNVTKYRDKLHHVEESIRKFVEREFLALLIESRAWRIVDMSVGRIEIASNSVVIELFDRRSPTDRFMISIQEQSGWLVAGLTDLGWLPRMTLDQRQTLQTALAGFYKLSGVDLVREQIVGCFQPSPPPYDVAERGLVVWPGGQFAVEVRYDLQQRPTISPRPRALAKAWELDRIESQDLVFAQSAVSWERWVAAWEAEREENALPAVFSQPIPMLPKISAAPRPSAVAPLDADDSAD
jgi:hypothetical protein